jgi:2-dehydro-3-deoxyphosphogluconate aldolase/(4S)-4-hydroxy-2-oxoglutarate aldolase
MAQTIKEAILRDKLIVIMRGIFGENALKLVDALHENGINLFEVTFPQSDPAALEKTSELIEQLTKEFGSAVCMGAGTVLSVQQANCAFQAGAKYIISPNVDERVIHFTKQVDLVSIPGAYTPSEIMTAYNAGADFIKLFPINAMGFSYIKDISAPLSHIPFIATGGVKEDNLCECLDLGMVGAGISSWLADRKLIGEGQFNILGERAARMVKMIQEHNA